MWSRSTRYDFYSPAFAMLGEQAVLNKEISRGRISKRRTNVRLQRKMGRIQIFPLNGDRPIQELLLNALDAWHLAEKFTTLPTLGATFIQANAPVARISAVASAGARFIFDGFFDVKTTRCMPLYSVPGLIDHF